MRRSKPALQISLAYLRTSVTKAPSFYKIMYYVIIITLIILFMICDINYFVRCSFLALCDRLYQNQASLKDVTTTYGVCTFQDCDVGFRSLRLDRLIRELDFARFHFYDRTGITRGDIKFLQRCTLTLALELVPLFMPYKINTTLVYWDECSLFLEHELITISDGRVRCVLVSCQQVFGGNGSLTEVLLKDIHGTEIAPTCPDYLKHWLMSMKITSAKLRPDAIY